MEGKKLEIATFGRQAITSPLNNHQANEVETNLKFSRLNCNQKLKTQHDNRTCRLSNGERKDLNLRIERCRSLLPSTTKVA